MFRSFCFTHRPKNGVEAGGPLETRIIKWCQKQPHYFLCAEKEDEARHLHGQVWLDVPREKGAITKTFQRIYQDLEHTPAEIKVMKMGVKIAYDCNFVENYLSKEDNILLNDPPANEADYYPSQYEQDKVKAKADAVDKKFHRWSEDLQEYACENQLDFPISLKDVAIFLGYMMFDAKKYQVIVDDKARKQNTKCLHAYVNSKFSLKMFLSDKDYEKIME